MRLVLDTNVVLSELLWHGAPHKILDRVRSGAVSLISSPALLAELAEVLGRAKFVTILARAGLSREHLLDEMRQFVDMVTPAPLPVAVCRDPDDDVVLAAALAAQVDSIVSGDAVYSTCMSTKAFLSSPPPNCCDSWVLNHECRRSVPALLKLCPHGTQERPRRAGEA